MSEKINEITEAQELKLKQAYSWNANDLEAIYHSGVTEEQHKDWKLNKGGEGKIRQWAMEKEWEKKKKLYGKDGVEEVFMKPTNHKEAEAVLKRHPDTRNSYGDKIDVTSDGKALPVPIIPLSLN